MVLPAKRLHGGQHVSLAVDEAPDVFPHEKSGVGHDRSDEAGTHQKERVARSKPSRKVREDDDDHGGDSNDLFGGDDDGDNVTDDDDGDYFFILAFAPFPLI